MRFCEHRYSMQERTNSVRPKRWPKSNSFCSCGAGLQPDILLPLHLVLLVPFHLRAAGLVGEGLWKSPSLCNRNIHLYSNNHAGICRDTWSQPTVRTQVHCNAAKGAGEMIKQCALSWGWYLHLAQDTLIFLRDLGHLLTIVSTILGKGLEFLKGPCLVLADPGRQNQIGVLFQLRQKGAYGGHSYSNNHNEFKRNYVISGRCTELQTYCH